MFKKRITSLLFAMAALLSSAAVSAQNKGYALYGDKPEGYTDLTSNVTASALGSTTFAEGVFTGTGLPGRFNETGNYLQLSLSAAQAMSLTDNFALHIVLQRTAAGSGKVQVSFCNGGWNAARAGWEIDGATITADAETDVVLKFADRNTNNYNTHNDGNLKGTDRSFNGEILRLCAANSESFVIKSIYLEATYTEPDPEPEPEPTGEKRYYFFSSREVLPSGDDLTSVDLREGAGTTIQWNGGMSAPLAAQTTYTSIPVTASWFSFNQNLKAATDMSSLASGGKLVIKMRSNLTGSSSSKPMMVRLCNGVSYNLYGDTYFDGEWHTHVFDLADAANHPTFNASMSSTIFQFHVNGSIGAGKIDIDFAYLTNDATNLDEGTASTDVTAPTGLTASASEVAQNSLKLTMTATDDSEGQITYVVTYDTDKTKSVKAASGADAEVVIDGLAADTDYSFSIIAKDAAGNTSDPVVVNQRTAKEPLGYALYGAVPTDFADLTGNVTIAKNGNTNWEAPTFTGAGNPGIIANSNNYLNVALSEAQTFALTDKFALHIRVKKVSGTNDVQVSFTSGDWNSCRAGWLIKNAKMSDADYTDFVLEYANTDATMSWSSQTKQNLLNGKIFSGTILRICAANGEQFDIDQIYLEKTYTAPADETAPANLTVNGEANKYNKVTFTFSATDENEEEITYLLSLNGGEAEEVRGASGVEQTKEYTELSESTSYTLSVIAKDAAGNESAPVTATVVTPAKPVVPTQDPQRIYLKKGTAVTPAGVTENVHTSYVISQYYNCIPGEDFYGVTTAVRQWWMNFQIQSNEAVDLSPVYGTWRLVVAFSSEVADQDREYTFTLGAISGTAGAPTVKKTYSAAKSGQRVVWQLPLSDALSIEEAEHLSAKAAGEYLLDMATGFNNEEGQRIEFDYIYFTNEDESDLDAPVFTKYEAEAQATKVILTLNATDEAEAITYTVSYENNGAQQVVATGVQGVDKEVVITGLQAETAYTFSITATDEHGNTSAPVVVNATTSARGTNRYYLYRGDNTSALPVVAGVNVVDVRPTAHAAISTGGNATRDAAQTEYIKYNVNNWFAINHTPSATVENDIDDSYYLVLRFKARLTSNFVTGNNLRVNLKNGAESFYINTTAEEKYNDALWHTVVLPLADVAEGKKPAQYLQAGQIALQIHENANPNKNGYIAIDYAYFTNDISVLDEGTVGDVITLSEIAEDNNVILADADGKQVDVEFDRGFEADDYQYTLCLPFSLDEEKAQLYFPGSYTKLESSELHGDLIHLNMVASSTIEAGVPYLYLPSEDVAAPMTIEDVVINSEAEPTITTTYFSMTGIYSPSSLPAGAYFLGEADYLVAVNPADNGKLKGFRSYFTIKESAPAGVRARVVFSHNTTTAIEAATTEETAPRKMLINSQIVIRRGDKTYDLRGMQIQ